MSSYRMGPYQPKTFEIIFDEVDAGLLEERAKRRLDLTGPRVGDFCYLKDGSLVRFTHHWGHDIQTTYPDMTGSFYSLWNGGLSYSGSLAPAIPIENIRLRPELREGSCWFFHHDRSGAHRGVDCTIPCRVYEVVS